MRKAFASFIILSLLSFCSLAKAESYTLEDLKVLAQENNYNEFIAHALDIRPGQRNDWWKENIRIMAKKYIEERIAQKDFSQTTYQQVSTLSTIPAIREDEFVTQRREVYLRSYLKNCFISSSDKMECFRKLNLFWDSTASSINRPEIALELAALLESNHIRIDRWKYYQAITTGQAAIFYCQREEIKDEIMTQLVSEFNRTSDLEKFFSRIKDIANDQCLEKILPELTQELSSEEIARAEMSYRLLLKNKLLNAEQSAAFLVSFIMMGPIVGETFNQGWNMVENLGKNYTLRMKVMAELKKYDPLPDGLINSANIKKRDLLLDLMNKNFPEYLDFYAATCLDYLEGKRVFPNGNPTKYCRLFFDLASNKEWPNSGHKIRYQNLPKYN